MASMESTYQEGGVYANPLPENVKNNLNETKSQDVPGFGSETPKEAALYKSRNMDNAIQQALNENTAGKTIIETAKSREQFEIDPATDPLFQVDYKNSAEKLFNISKDPESAKVDSFVEKTCEEGGEEVTHQCFENRHVVPKVPMKTMTLNVDHLDFTEKTVKKKRLVKKARWYRHAEYEDYTVPDGWATTLPKDISDFRKVFCPKFDPNINKIETTAVINIDCSKIKSYKINSDNISEADGIYTITTPQKLLNITLNHDTYEGEEIDEWQSACDSLESMVDEGLCQHTERILSQGPETRNIQGYQITKDAWQYKKIYHCKMIKDDCAPLRAKGCHQIRSKCKEKKEDRCWIYEQTYQCPDGKLSMPKTKSPLLEAFCLTGDCHNTSYEANDEMLEVISRLSLLKEIQNDIQAQGNSNLKIFKGNKHQCSRNCKGFKDCCNRLKGWGISLNVAQCTSEENALFELKDKNLCHRVGTYCSRKSFGQCATRKTTFCCFGSKFARLLQEQGRSQLGLGWGTGKCPNCRGLTVEELSRMDLSKMDFRELFLDVMQKYKQPDHKALQERAGQKIQQNIHNMEHGLKTKNPKSGVLEDNKNAL